MGNMREISIDECRKVSGGSVIETIVVTGAKVLRDDGGYSSWGYGGSSYGGYTSYSGSGYYGSGGGAVQGPQMVDTDGDGVPDSPEIVVTASITHDQIQNINQLAGWYQWGQNLALGLFAGERLMVSGLTAAGQLAAGTAIAGTTSLPSIDDAHYQANWNYLYWVQVGVNEGYNSGNGLIYYP